MTEEQQMQVVREACVKAACAGFAQSLINQGYEPQEVQAATVHYAHPENGLLTKRASQQEDARELVSYAILKMRNLV